MALRLPRRAVLRMTVVTAGSCCARLLGGCTLAAEESSHLFPQGVASGDPRPDSIVLWTRIEPADTEAARVTFEVARDEAFEQLVAVETDPVLRLAGLYPLVPQLDEVLAASNPHYRYVKNLAHGLAIVDVDRASEMRVSFLRIGSVMSPSFSDVAERVTFRTPAGSSLIERL